MQAAAIIQKAVDSGVRDLDKIFSRVRNELPSLPTEEIQSAMAAAGFRHDGLVNPALTTIGNDRRPYGFTRF